jgi:hypothetical protein
MKKMKQRSTAQFEKFWRARETMSLRPGKETKKHKKKGKDDEDDEEV